MTGPNVRSIEEYRARDSEAVLLCALKTLRTEGTDGLMLTMRSRGKPARTWVTGEYARDPQKAKDLLARVWRQIAKDGAEITPLTVRGGL